MKFIKNDRIFRLVFFNVSHTHQDLRKEDNVCIEAYISTLPISMKLKDAKAIVLNRFKISSRKFYYLYRKSTDSKGNFT